MSTATFDPLQTTDRFYTVMKSLSEFDKIEVRGVIQTLLSTSDRERCFIGTYQRATANIATLLEFKHAKHFQAIAMLARGLFELAVDVRLIDVIPDGPQKDDGTCRRGEAEVCSQDPSIQGVQSSGQGRYHHLQFICGEQ